ncbi:MAG: hypothetical protein ACRC4L_00060 [Mycoplasma sp.]
MNNSHEITLLIKHLMESMFNQIKTSAFALVIFWIIVNIITFVILITFFKHKNAISHKLVNNFINNKVVQTFSFELIGAIQIYAFCELLDITSIDEDDSKDDNVSLLNINQSIKQFYYQILEILNSKIFFKYRTH